MPKLRTKALVLFFSAFFLSGCGTASSSSASVDSLDETSTSLPYHEEYSMYYGIWDHAGLNLYCWTIDEEWFAGLSTARSGVYDSVEDVEALQEIGCPISVMKDILLSYGEEIVAYQVTVFVASVPPLQEELIPGSESREQYAEDILYLCEYFGIDPYYQSL